MKNTTRATSAPQVGPAFAGIVTRTTSNATTGGTEKTISIDLGQLPVENPHFNHGLVDLAISRLVLSGVHTQEKFIEACIKAGTPDRKILGEAQKFLDAVEGDEPSLTWEELEASVFKKYGWKLESRDINGLISHFTRKADKERPTGLLDNL